MNFADTNSLHRSHRRISLVFCILGMLVLCACTEKRYRVPCGRQDIHIARYDQAFFHQGVVSDSIFWALYTNQIMQIGESSDASTIAFMNVIRQDSDLFKVYLDCQQTFSDMRAIERKVGKAFHRLCHFVPDIPIPLISTHISGFGQSVVSAPNRLSVSLDKFLGADYPLYENLFYSYQSQRMSPERIPAEYLNGWIRSEFTNESIMQDHCLLDYLIYEGKILFLMRLIYPKEPLAYLTGFSKEKMEWCQNNEKRMWERILEYEHLYSRDPLVLSKYIGDGPFTVYFTEESPARAAIWSGYKIIERYMKLHPAVSLLDLMMDTDARKLFNESLYRP